MGWIIERGMVPVNCEIAIFDLKGALAPQDKPLMLQPVLFCPVLTWAAQELMDCGVQRYFIVCPEKWRQEVLDDLPGCDVTFFDDAEAALSAGRWCRYTARRTDAACMPPTARCCWPGCGLGPL